MTDLTYETIHELLVEAIPEFRPVLEEHLRDQEGEVLQHVMFGDLTGFVLAARDRGDRALVARCWAFLDHAANSPRPRVSNLVAVSFVENVGPWKPKMFLHSGLARRAATHGETTGMERRGRR
jgi:hypothetical protein